MHAGFGGRAEKRSGSKDRYPASLRLYSWRARFGFRPKRAQHDALQVLIDEAWRGRRWVVEAHIANCFPAIPHEKLIQAIEERVCDQTVLKLLRAMLRVGVIQDGVVRREVTGTPQAA